MPCTTLLLRIWYYSKEKDNSSFCYHGNCLLGPGVIREETWKRKGTLGAVISTVKRYKARKGNLRVMEMGKWKQVKASVMLGERLPKKLMLDQTPEDGES
jgi:hypothetical protein